MIKSNGSPNDKCGTEWGIDIVEAINIMLLRYVTTHDLCNDCTVKALRISAETITKLRRDMREIFTDGMIQGFFEYAHWKDGVQYVGTCGKTLDKAIEEVKKQARLDG